MCLSCVGKKVMLFNALCSQIYEAVAYAFQNAKACDVGSDIIAEDDRDLPSRAFCLAGEVESNLIILLSRNMHAILSSSLHLYRWTLLISYRDLLPQRYTT